MNLCAFDQKVNLGEFTPRINELSFTLSVSSTLSVNWKMSGAPFLSDAAPLLVGGVAGERSIQQRSVPPCDAVTVRERNDHVTTRVRLRQVQARVHVLPLVAESEN